MPSTEENLAAGAGGFFFGAKIGEALFNWFSGQDAADARIELAHYKAEIHHMNQKAHEMGVKAALFQADDAMSKEAKAVGAVEKNARALRGAQRAAAAASGLDSSFGSAKVLQAEGRLNADLDGITAKNNVWREAWGYKLQAGNEGIQALNSWMQGNLEIKAGYADANATISTAGLGFAGTFVDIGKTFASMGAK